MTKLSPSSKYNKISIKFIFFVKKSIFSDFLKYKFDILGLRKIYFIFLNLKFPKNI